MSPEERIAPGGSEPKDATPPGQGRVRRRRRHRKRRKPVLAQQNFRWWHVLLAIAVGLLGVAMTTAVLANRDQP